MPIRLSTVDADFESRFTVFLHSREEEAQHLAPKVSEIIAQVRSRGDEAVADFTRLWDWPDFRLENIRVSDAEIASARRACGKDVLEALKTVRKRVTAYHKKQLPKSALWKDKEGVTLGWRWTPLDAVGIYVPGGLAAYPSTVLMNAIPAVVAGVPRIAMVVPAPKGEINPAVLAAASIAGVTEIYRIGGAQAVAALAYGTRSIASVDKIVGPGNAYVAEAKRQVFGRVGIDTIAGPSEILVIADNRNNPEWIAADLLSQAEHDPVAQSVLLTDDSAFAQQVESTVQESLRKLPRASIAGASWQNYGAVIVARDLTEAAGISNRIAPEHLELAVENPDALLAHINHAGAVFLGRHTPEAIGDYIAGPSHVLPTSRAARFSSGLSVLDFMKRTSLIGCSPAGAVRIGPAASTLANAEGLQAHALSVDLRLAERRD
jgi:histidinol dehydrogenase